MNQKLKSKYIELHKRYGDVRIECEAKDSLPLDVILDFQGDLKSRTTENKIKLATQIFKSGFCAPFFVWSHEGDYYFMDGHGRSEVLCEIREAGIPIPGFFPIAYVFAKTEIEAREKLTAITSQYGDVDLEALSEWVEDFDNETKESFRLLEKEIEIPVEDIAIVENIPVGSFDDNQATTINGDVWSLGNNRLFCSNKEDETEIIFTLVKRYRSLCIKYNKTPEIKLNGEIYEF